MTNAPSITEQHSHFNPESWDGWSYVPNQGSPGIAYASGVHYIHDCGSLAELSDRSDREARRVQLTEARNSLTQDGIYLQVICRPSEQPEVPWQRLKYEPPVPMDDAISGEQARLTGSYPRVVFPAHGSFNYGFAFLIDPAEAMTSKLGLTEEVHEIRVHDGASRSSISVPDGCPCDREVRKAIAEFANGFSIPQGVYRVTLEVERMPVVLIRIDGGRPINSTLLRSGPLKAELPVMDLFSGGEPFKFLLHDTSSERPDPFRRPVRGAKYAEMACALPVDLGPESLATITGVELRTDADKSERADLVYVSLRRGESVEEVHRNPFLGLVEVQIDRVARIRSIEIDFKPEVIPNPNALLSEFSDGPGDGFLMTRGGGGAMRSFGSAPVNVGRTELAKPRVGKASPTMEAEFDGHLGTMRFMVTNAIN